jgi:DNA polymerase-3 subunit delta
MSQPPAVVRIFYGGDEPRLRDALKAFLYPFETDGSAGMNITRLEGRSTSIGEIEGAASTLPFLSEARLVLVDNFTEHSDIKAQIEALPESIQSLPDWARVVFIETGLGESSGDSTTAQKRRASRKGMLKKLVSAVENDPRGKALAFDLPTNDNERIRWIQERAAGHGAKIEKRAAAMLSGRLGDNLNLADMELLKLATYTNAERPISEADVDLLTPYQQEASIFALVDALGNRDGRQALTLFQKMRDEGQEPLYLFAMFVRQFRLMLLIKEQLDRGRTYQAAAGIIGIKEYPAKKLAAQSRHYTLDQLERIYRLLLQTDLALKTGGYDREQVHIPLESLIYRLSR